MASTQTFVSPENWYSLQYPRTWEMEVIEGIPSFFDGINPYGGALQVFAVNQVGAPNADLIKQSPFMVGKTLNEKLRIFLSKQGISDEGAQFFERDKTLMGACEYRSGGHFYLILMAERGSIFVLALYNCKGEPEAEEAANVGRILQSVTIL
ncbi:hypothetical protein [Turneriella parva]|uniref:Uncharacterized protein n=1 Tax=Turneriella parva (strain ATCC BAA-1111 / DSM 21527 / NCTC 11395 / H) TaxID=869212 RepID=I4B878_TURPD|nr:hypothetical protein [Turneriella parva]AFM13485.1 hypothetical protein Turpa_2846 [Turneriella parva DSM 21527]